MTTSAPLSNRAAFNRRDLSIRAARSEDRTDVEAIAAQVWDGGDYVPDVFDEWLADPAGMFCVAVLHDQVVGLAKLTRFAPGQWWLEGMRVDPAYRGQGIARILHHYLINQARRHAPGVLRFSTASDNTPMHRLAVEAGFRLAASFAPYGALAVANPTGGLTRLDSDDAGRAWAFIESAPHFDAAQRTAEYHWEFLPLTPDLLRERIAAGLVYGWGGEPLQGIALLNPPDDVEDELEDRRVYIGYLDAVAGQIAPLAAALRGLVFEMGFPRVSLRTLSAVDVLAELEKAGYERRWHGEVFLFARDLSLTEQAGTFLE